MSAKQKITQLLSAFAAVVMGASANAQLRDPVPQTPSPSGTTTATAAANSNVNVQQKTGDSTFYGGLAVGVSSAFCSITIGIGAQGAALVLGIPMGDCRAELTATQAYINAINAKNETAAGIALNVLQTASPIWAAGITLSLNHILKSQCIVDPGPAAGLAMTKVLTFEDCFKINAFNAIHRTPSVTVTPPPIQPPAGVKFTAAGTKTPCTTCKPVQNNNQKIEQNIQITGTVNILDKDGKFVGSFEVPPKKEGTPALPAPQ